MLLTIKLFIALLSSFNSIVGDVVSTESPGVAQFRYTTVFAGIISPGSGEKIYKDETTITLEKLVIPWLKYYTNQYRKENGLDSLQYDDCLMQAALYHSDYLFNEAKETDVIKLVHSEDPASKWFKGTSPSDRAFTAGCKKHCGENALFFTSSGLPAANFADQAKLNEVAKKMAKEMVFERWHNSKAHRENMLKKGYTSLGVSVAIGKQSLEGMEQNPGIVNLVVFGVQVMAY
jgi:hypothetical protein